MTKYIISAICLILIIAIFGCSKQTKDVSNLQPGDEKKESESDPTTIDLFDLSANIFEDLETQFKDSSVILESLQKNKKGTLVEAKIAHTDCKTAVPKCVLLLSENFKRLQEINILVGDEETPYSIKVDTIDLLSEENKDNALKNAIWDEIDSNRKVPAVDECDEDSPQAAGV